MNSRDKVVIAGLVGVVAREPEPYWQTFRLRARDHVQVVVGTPAYRFGAYVYEVTEYLCCGR